MRRRRPPPSCRDQTPSPPSGQRGVPRTEATRRTTEATRRTTEATRRTMTCSTAMRPREFRDFVEISTLDALDHELADAVADREADGLTRVEVHHDHLDLTTVPRVDRAGSVDQRYSAPRCEAGPGMYERGVPVGQRDGYAGREHDPFAGRELGRLRGDQIGAGVTGMRVRRHPDVRMNSPDKNRQTGHGFTSTCGAWLERFIEASTRSGRPNAVKCSTGTVMNKAADRSASVPSVSPDAATSTPSALV